MLRALDHIIIGVNKQLIVGRKQGTILTRIARVHTRNATQFSVGIWGHDAIKQEAPAQNATGLL